LKNFLLDDSSDNGSDELPEVRTLTELLKHPSDGFSTRTYFLPETNTFLTFLVEHF